MNYIIKIKAHISLTLIIIFCFFSFTVPVIGTFGNRFQLEKAAINQVNIITTTFKFFKVHILRPYLSAFIGLENISGKANASGIPGRIPLSRSGNKANDFFKQIYFILSKLLIQNKEMVLVMFAVSCLMSMYVRHNTCEVFRASGQSSSCTG